MPRVAGPRPVQDVADRVGAGALGRALVRAVASCELALVRGQQQDEQALLAGPRGDLAAEALGDRHALVERRREVRPLRACGQPRREG